MQKILRNGRTVTIFTVGTGGMFDQRIIGSKDLPKPAQWHRIAVHNDSLGAYAVQQLVKRYIVNLYRAPFQLDREKKINFLYFSLSHECIFGSVLQFMLRETLKLEFTMTASVAKLKTFLRYVFVVMVCLLLIPPPLAPSIISSKVVKIMILT